MFYLLFALIQYVGGVKDIFDFSILDVGLFVVFNDPFIIAGQLWFMFALLYDYVLFCVVTKTNTVNWAHKIIPILIVLYVFFAQGAVLLGIHIPKLLYRNFLIEGFAFFMLGHWLHSNEQKVKAINNTALVIGIISTTLLCVAERYYMGRDFGVNVFSFPQVFFLFVYAMNNAAAYKNTALRKLGSRCSMFVYILHPFVWHSLEYGYQWMGIDESTIALYLLPLIVLGLSILLSLLITTKKKRGIV